MDVRQKFFMERIVKHGERSPRIVVEEPLKYLQVFKRHVDGWHLDMIEWWMC